MSGDQAVPMLELRDTLATGMVVGSIEGMLAHAPDDVSQIFFARSVVTGLVAGLRASGTPVDRGDLEDWVSASGPPPQVQQPDRIDPSTLVAVMLRELRHMPGRLGAS